MDCAVAVVQTRPAPGDVAGNLARARALLAEAAEEGAAVAVLPEWFATGWDAGEAAARAEPAGGPVETALAAAARELDLVLVAVLPERRAAGVAGAALVVGADGVLLRRAKRRRWEAERDALIPGDAPAVAATEAAAVAPLACYEVEFPEDARAAARAGAALLAVSAAFTTPRLWDLHTRARAVENGVFVAAANAGPPFCGASRVVAPDGRVLAAVDGWEGVAVARCDDAAFAAWRREHPYLDDLP